MSSAKPEVFFSMDTGIQGQILTFVEYEQMREFFERELASWNWLNELTTSGRIPPNVYQIIVNGITHVLGQLPAYQGRQPGYQDSLKSLINGYIIGAKIPLSDSQTHRAIATISETDHLKAGLAIAAQMNSVSAAQTIDHLRAAFEMIAIENGISRQSTRAAQGSLKKLLTEQSAENNITRSDTLLQREQFKTEQKKVKRFLKGSLIAQKNIFRKNIADVNFKGDEAIKKLTDVELAYRSQMQLKAPVEYWSKKAEQHKKKSESYRNILAKFASVGGIALIFGLLYLADHTIDLADSNKPSSIYFVLATIGVVSSTIVFWVARVLTRLFLSEHHLAIDADERSTMVQTYLALTLDNKISETERALVLAPLFRPTADGIVKDDSAPDISPAGMLSKIMSQRS